MKSKALALALSFVWILALLSGCSNDNGGPSDPAPTLDSGSISGIVNSTSAELLAGVVVAVNGTSTTTDSEGYFKISDLPVGDQVVRISLAGFAANFRLVEVIAEANFYLPDIVLMPRETVIIAAASGGTAATGDGRGTISFEPNSFASADGTNYSGDVTVAINAAVPGDGYFYGVFPGRYEGIRADGGAALIQSFGFLNVDLFAEDGAPLALKTGIRAGLTLNIGADLANSAPDSLPLWYYDETDGQWHEEGVATLNNTVYSGTVAHFSYWNCDIPVDGPRLCEIVGYVLRDNGDPVDKAQVTALVPSGGLGAVGFTNEQGFYRLRFQKDRDVTIWAAKGEDLSTPIFTNLGVICPAQIDLPFDVFQPVFVVTVTQVAEEFEPFVHFYLPRTLDDGQDPDYDWHHISDTLIGQLAVFPYVLLAPHLLFEGEPDRLFGETFTLGTNEFWIAPHPSHFATEMAASETEVTLEIGGSTRTFVVTNVPTIGLQRDDWWHVFDIEVAVDSTATVVPVMRFEARHDRENVYPDAERD